MRARAQATVRVRKKQLENQAHSRCDIRDDCGLPAMGGDLVIPPSPLSISFPTYKKTRVHRGCRKCGDVAADGAWAAGANAIERVYMSETFTPAGGPLTVFGRPAGHDALGAPPSRCLADRPAKRARGCGSDGSHSLQRICRRCGFDA